MKYIIIFLIAVLFSNQASAGAWVLNDGETLSINNLYYYKTNTFFDAGGFETKQPAYKKRTINTYLEEGITEDITLGSSVFYEFIKQNGYNNQGFGDSEFFLRKLLYKNDNSVISIQPLVKIPSASADSLPKIGTEGWEAELKLLYGRNFGNNHYLDTAIGFRKRFEGSSDQLRWELKFGFRPNDKWTIMPAFYGINNIGGISERQVIITNENDYSLVKAELSVLYNITPKWAVQIGAYQDIYSRNTGKGYGGIFSIWQRF